MASGDLLDGDGPGIRNPNRAGGVHGPLALLHRILPHEFHLPLHPDPGRAALFHAPHHGQRERDGEIPQRPGRGTGEAGCPCRGRSLERPESESRVRVYKSPPRADKHPLTSQPTPSTPLGRAGTRRRDAPASRQPRQFDRRKKQRMVIPKLAGAVYLHARPALAPQRLRPGSSVRTLHRHADQNPAHPFLLSPSSARVHQPPAELQPSARG